MPLFRFRCSASARPLPPFGPMLFCSRFSPESCWLVSSAAAIALAPVSCEHKAETQAMLGSGPLDTPFPNLDSVVSEVHCNDVSVVRELFGDEGNFIVVNHARTQAEDAAVDGNALENL